MPSDLLIKVEHVARFYGNLCAVDNVSFEVHRGEVLGLLGPNGAGKSTLMQMMTGNLAPTVGSIMIKGFDVINQAKRAKVEIGYLPEQPPLYIDYTVNEYLVYCARLRRIPTAEINSRLEKVKQLCGLPDVGHRLIANLSKGYKQRVGLAQAIIHRPAVVVLDEPTVGLDPLQVREIRELIRELGRDHGVILSSHILPEVQSVCDHVQILNRGKTVLSSTMDKLDLQMQASNLLVAFNNPPSIQALSDIESILDAQQLTTQRFKLRFHPQDNPSEMIVKLSVQKDWRLYELTPENISLEDIFINITCSEPEEDEFKRSPDVNNLFIKNAQIDKATL